MKFSQAFKLNANYYNQNSMVSPEGKVYPLDVNLMDAVSHPDWADQNYKQHGIDFTPVVNKEYGNEMFDQEGHVALDKYFHAGWIRIKSNTGIEMEGLHSIPLIKKIIMDMAKSNEGGAIFIDTHDSSINVPIDFRGRPDFRKLDEKIR